MSIPALVKTMIEAGAIFYVTECGTWIIPNLGELPAWLVDEFYESDERELGRYLKNCQTIQKPAGDPSQDGRPFVRMAPVS